MTAAQLKELAQAQRRQGDLEAAAKTLQQAIAQSETGAERAELYGILGGTRRQQEDLVAAAAAYDAGYHLESADSTYNGLNRLVTRIALEPAALTDAAALRTHPELEFVDVPRELATLQSQLKQQGDGPRANDVWAIGDLALTATLNGDVDAAIAALERLDRLAPSPDVYAKYRETFGALAHLDTPRKTVLMQAEEWLVQRG